MAWHRRSLCWSGRSCEPVPASCLAYMAQQEELPLGTFPVGTVFAVVGSAWDGVRAPIFVLVSETAPGVLSETAPGIRTYVHVEVVRCSRVILPAAQQENPDIEQPQESPDTQQ